MAVALHCAPASAACTWDNITPKNAAELVPEQFNYADTVVHGRVVARTYSEGVANVEIEVIRAFKGQLVLPLMATGHAGYCGYLFTFGEERIFFIKEGSVGAAGAKPVSPWLLASLNVLNRTAPPVLLRKPVSRIAQIRVRNDSERPFFNVVVGGKVYGEIAPGGKSRYQPWTEAYRYAPVVLFADSRERRIDIIDYVGETPLGEGRFTYVLTYLRGQLGIRVERDAE